MNTDEENPIKDDSRRVRYGDLRPGDEFRLERNGRTYFVGLMGNYVDLYGPADHHLEPDPDTEVFPVKVGPWAEGDRSTAAAANEAKRGKKTDA